MGRLAGVILGIQLVLLAGCTSTNSGTATVQASNARLQVTITRAEFGDAWPFTVEEGVLECRNGSEVVFTANGVTYAVGDAAKGRGVYADVTEIWQDEPGLPGIKKNIGPVIQRALAMAK